MVDLDARLLLGFEAPASQVKVSPLNIVATKTSPKLSRLQLPGSRITELVDLAVPPVAVFQVESSGIPIELPIISLHPKDEKIH